MHRPRSKLWLSFSLIVAVAVLRIARSSQPDNEDTSVDQQSAETPPAETPPDEKPPDEKPEVKRRLDAMALRVGGIHAWCEKDGERQALGNYPEPLFRLIDTTRNHPDGTVWAWPRKGRPAAMLTLSLLGGSQSVPAILPQPAAS